MSHTHASYRNLAAAILLQALTDLERPRQATRWDKRGAASRQQEAREFLLGPDGAWYATMLGIEPGAVRAAVGGQHGRRNTKTVDLPALR